MIEFRPQSVEEMSARFWWAVADPVLDREPGCVADPSHVFDWQDGLRMIVTRASHAAFAVDGKAIKISVSSGHGGLAQLWWNVSHDNLGPVFSRVADLTADRYQQISGCRSVLLHKSHAKPSRSGVYVFHFWIGEPNYGNR